MQYYISAVFFAKLYTPKRKIRNQNKKKKPILKSDDKKIPDVYIKPPPTHELRAALAVGRSNPSAPPHVPSFIPRSLPSYCWYMKYKYQLSNLHTTSQYTNLVAHAYVRT